jgi:hypothetical protein
MALPLRRKPRECLEEGQSEVDLVPSDPVELVLETQLDVC